MPSLSTYPLLRSLTVLELTQRMGLFTSKLLPIEFVVNEEVTFYNAHCEFIQWLLRTQYFRDAVVTNLKTFIVERDNILGVMLPSNLQTMLIFKKGYKTSRNRVPIRCVRFYKKEHRWPFQGLFFPIGEIGLGLQEERSGKMIHALRTGCLQYGQRVQVYVLKNPSVARLLAGAQSQHWTRINEANPAIIDMFETRREQDRADQIDKSQIFGTLKIFYVDQHHRYLRRGSYGPMGPLELPFKQGTEFKVGFEGNRDIFVWFILETSDHRIFQSRQMRVYSRMFFRNKFGCHACREWEEEEQRMNEQEENQACSIDDGDNMQQHMKDITSNRPGGMYNALKEDAQIDAIRGPRSTLSDMENASQLGAPVITTKDADSDETLPV